MNLGFLLFCTLVHTVKKRDVFNKKKREEEKDGGMEGRRKGEREG